MFKSRRLFPYFLFSFIVVSAVFSLSLSNVSKKRVILRQKAAEEQQPSPVSEWVPIDLASFNQEVDKETAELTKELNNLPSLNLSAKEKTKREDLFQRSLQIKQITKEEHNLMDEDQDGKIDYEEFNKRDVILAEKVYQLRHTTISTLDNGLYDEQMVRITIDNLNQHTSPNNNVLRVFVEAGVYQDIYAYLVRYRTDVQRDWNYDVRFYLCNNCTKETTNPGPVGIKNLLRVQGTVGTVFVGDLPAAWYFIPASSGCLGYPHTFPIDLYFSDLDGVWGGETDCTSSYGGISTRCYTTHTGDLDPEIFFGRLEAPDESIEVRLINNYFRKNHKYRTETPLLPHRSLNYFDDDWSIDGPGWSGEMAPSYPFYDLISDRETTSATDYINRWSASFEHLFLTAHANPYRHLFNPSTQNPERNVFWQQVRDLKPHFYFYSLYSCSNALFAVENYIGGWYVFQEGDFGLATISSSKIGGIVNIDGFYQPLAEGKSLGLAFREWYRRFQLGSDKCWAGGMTIIGDPTLRILPNPPTPTPTPRVLHFIDSPQQNMSYSSPFDFTGWTIWEDGRAIEKVEFYMDLPKGQVGIYGAAYTNLFDRPDLCDLNRAYCRAGWSWRFNTTFVNPGRHKVYVYAYDNDAPGGYVGSPVTREFIVVRPPTPTPTRIPCPRPGEAGVILGPGEGQRINYGDPVLKIVDGSPPNSCFPHDVVFSIWQNNIKKISSTWIEDVLPSGGSQYEWQVNPPLGTGQFPPGTYQWRANLKNTASQTCHPELILKVNFTVCARPAGPKIAELMFGNTPYRGGTVTVKKGDDIRVRVRDDSDNNSCFPHEVFLGIWPAGSVISPETAIRDSNWQAETTNQERVFPRDSYWIFPTYDLEPNNYQLAAIFKNNSLDREGRSGGQGSMSLESEVVSFALSSCSGVGVCSGSCPPGRECRVGGDNYCDCF